jgi:hypothetical protein
VVVGAARACCQCRFPEVAVVVAPAAVPVELAESSLLALVLPHIDEREYGDE